MNEKSMTGNQTAGKPPRGSRLGKLLFAFIAAVTATAAFGDLVDLDGHILGAYR